MGDALLQPSLEGLLAELAARVAMLERLTVGFAGLRIVRGVISTATPTIVSGSGFSVVRNGTGDVTVTFTTSFKDVPAVETDVASGGTFDTRLAIDATVSTARIVVFNTSTGAASDASYVSFIAVGA